MLPTVQRPTILRWGPGETSLHKPFLVQTEIVEGGPGKTVEDGTRETTEEEGWNDERGVGRE